MLIIFIKDCDGSNSIFPSVTHAYTFIALRQHQRVTGDAGNVFLLSMM